MNFLPVNQFFAPDPAPTVQLPADLASALATHLPACHIGLVLATEPRLVKRARARARFAFETRYDRIHGLARLFAALSVETANFPNEPNFESDTSDRRFLPR